MPNINTLQAITSATSSTFLVVSDQGVARRLNFSGISSQIEQNFTTGVRTDQNLYTTSTVRFIGANLRGEAGSLYIQAPESIGYTFDHFHKTGNSIESIKAFDTLGSIRFGGYDGSRYLALDRKSSAIELFGFAYEDWEATTNTVTNAGSALSLAIHPPATRLDTVLSRQRLMTFTWRSRAGGTFDNAGNPQPAIANIILGSGQGPTTATSVPTLINDLNTQRYKGYGSTALYLQHSQVTQFGVPNEDEAFFFGSIDGEDLTITQLEPDPFGRIGTVSPGQMLTTVANLTTTNVVFGTEIVSQTSGAPGGTGTYKINILQTTPNILLHTGPDNTTLKRTNSYIFNTARGNALPATGGRQPLKTNDTIGEIQFVGNDVPYATNFLRTPAANIRAKAIQDFTTSSHGTVVEISVAPIGVPNNNVPAPLPDPVASLGYGVTNFYSSNYYFNDHTNNPNPPLYVSGWSGNGASFYSDALTVSPNGSVGTKFYGGAGSGVTIKQSGITFPDGSVQTTAFDGTTSTSQTTIINQPAFRQVSKPASATAPGEPGDIFYTSSFIYLCVNTSTWRKIAIAVGGVW